MEQLDTLLLIHMASGDTAGPRLSTFETVDSYLMPLYSVCFLPMIFYHSELLKTSLCNHSPD